MNRIIYGKNAKPMGVTPSVVLLNPKYPHNVGAVLRAASCYGLKQVWFTGSRIQTEIEENKRIPREERFKGYGEVQLINFDYPLDPFPKDVVPVAIEIKPNSENLPDFEHPEKAVYLFGPEDGSVPSVYSRLCHRFVVIPSRHCLNLSAAVYTILYDRMCKRYKQNIDSIPVLDESRGFECGLERE